MDAFRQDRARADELVLVDVLDRPIGTATKELAHAQGLLHRAFSVVLLRENAGAVQVLLARRAQGKYHSSGLWGNSCCSHPRAGEPLDEAVPRRVQEELGMSVTGISEIGSFVYRSDYSNGLAEYEYDHVFVARSTETPHPDVREVDAIWWIDADELCHTLTHRPEFFATWARTVLPMALANLQ